MLYVMSPAGYDVSQWKQTLLKLGQTKVFFSTTATFPYRSESDTHIKHSFIPRSSPPKVK